MSSSIGGNATGAWRRNTTGEEEFGNSADPFNRILSNLGGDHSIHVSLVCPGPVNPSLYQLKVAKGYAIRCKDGTYTRLIPANELQEFNIGIPASQQGPENLIILPATELPSELTGPFQYVTGSFVQSLPMNRPNRPNSNVPFAGARVYEDSKAKTQREIDHIVAKNPVGTMTSPFSAMKSPPRKEYCDMWIHSGNCAFTQVGCKYKHIMPTDKPTQMKLGLNHGLPVWYKRAMAVNLRPEPQSSSSSAGPWRRSDGHGVSLGRGMFSSPSGDYSSDAQLVRSRGLSGSHPATYNSSGVPLGRGMSDSHRPHAASGSGQQLTGNNFGPIGRPPPPRYQQPVASTNPYAVLPEEGDASDVKMEDNDADEEGEIAWTGRNR